MTSILNVPVPNKEPRQKSIDISDLFLTRFTPPWSRPASLPAAMWRMWVLNQPVAVVCRETLIANLLSLDWKITPRDSKYKEELEPTIKHYTKLLARGGEYAGLGLDFSGLVEWIVGDLLDIPFGGAAEIGRKGETESGRVQWIRPIDGGTLFPTLNQEFPIVQYYPSYSTDVVVFRPWEMSRTYMSPHSFILREGWGMAPPEKVYFALDLLTKGDKYYANLLLDIPTAGILDLGDMEKSSAEEWITAFKTFVNDTTTSFKIPVLYEHNNKTEFIPFGKVPNDIMFNHITLKYAALVAAAYGMSLSDIGLGTTSASGETLAGSIRQERRTRKTGHARVKTKAKWFFDQILPDVLEFNWIDYDDELNVALGRARLGSSQAFAAFRQMGLFSPQELRSQAIVDGLVSISLPDELPADAKPDPAMTANGEPELVGNPKAPSGGGEGDVKKSIDTVSFKPKSKVMNGYISKLVAEFAPKVIETLSSVSEDEIEVWRSTLIESVLEDNVDFGIQLSDFLKAKSLGTLDFGDLESVVGDKADVLKANIKNKLGEYIGRAVLVNVLTSQADSENIVQDVIDRIHTTLPEYIHALANQEFYKLDMNSTNTLKVQD
jgi:hypothetical protein